MNKTIQNFILYNGMENTLSVNKGSIVLDLYINYDRIYLVMECLLQGEQENRKYIFHKIGDYVKNNEEYIKSIKTEYEILFLYRVH